MSRRVRPSCTVPSWAFIALALSLSFALSSAVQAEGSAHWPQWRGPQDTGVAPTAEPPLRWGEGDGGDTNIRFKVPVPGKGHASPVVWGDRLFLLTAVPVATPKPAGEIPDEASGEGGDDRARWNRGVSPDQTLEFTVLAYDRHTGEVVWERVARREKPHEGTHTDGTWASASAVTDGRHVWAFFGSRGLYCYTVDGERVWERDLGDMTTRRGFGEGASPALAGDTLVVNWDHEGDSFIVALNARTGEERWRRQRDEPTSWSTPVIVPDGERHQVVVSATQRVRAYDLETGDLVWSTGGMTLNSIPTPVVGDDLLYVTSGFRGNALKAIRWQGARGDLDGSERVAWSFDRDTPYVPSPVLTDGVLLVPKHNRGILTAFDAKTGEVLWGPERLPEVQGLYASLVAADGRVYVAGRDGTTVVLKAGRTFEVLAVNHLGEGIDATPAPAGDTLYVRGRNHLYALAGEGGGAAQAAESSGSSADEAAGSSSNAPEATESRVRHR